MDARRNRWLYVFLVAVALMASLVSLLALFELNAPRWTTPLNILALVCIVLAGIARGSGANPHDR